MPTLKLSLDTRRPKKDRTYPLNWVDIENEYYTNLVEIYTSYKQSYRKQEKENLIRSLNNSLIEIKTKLIEYLAILKIEEVGSKDYIKMQINKLFTEHNQANSNNSGIVYKMCVLNFNYTNTIFQYLYDYKESDNNYQVINIHGNLMSPESVIFGYGDMMDVNFKNLKDSNYNPYLEHIKHYHYLQSQEFHKLIQFINWSKKTKYEVSIMGHSCGLSDRILLNRIFNHETCSRIKIYYHQISPNKDDYFEKVLNISRHFDEENNKRMEIIQNKILSTPLGKAKNGKKELVKSL